LLFGVFKSIWNIVLWTFYGVFQKHSVILFCTGFERLSEWVLM